ncbi:uncharacterized protein ACRADG_007865 [Cochliomyia hominivorax]
MFSNKILFTILLIFSVVILAQSEIDLNILKLLSNSRDYEVDCYINYITESQEVAENYKYGNEACRSESDNQRNKTDLETLVSRQDLENRTELSCESIAHCKKSSAVDVEYECYRDLGNENHKNFQIISDDASSELALYMQKISAIRFNEIICTNKTKTTFNEENLVVKEKLNDCLRGNGWATNPSPTPKPTTTPIVPTKTTEKTKTTKSVESTTSESKKTTDEQ